jgi:cyclophilin family peptidyl-prolyl cis-trans isomerase
MKTLIHLLISGNCLMLAALVLAGLGMVQAADDKKLGDGLYAEFDTSKGKILVQLEFEKVPLTVANFVGLAEGTKYYSTATGQAPKAQNKPFYDGLSFHRVIANFMIQGGDPQGTGSGGPGYRFRDEIDPSLKHSGPGTLSMANAGPNTNGSQFFITHVPTPWLDGKHTVFGHVVTGQEIVNRIAQGDKINTLKILRVGDKAKAFKADEEAFQNLSKK